MTAEADTMKYRNTEIQSILLECNIAPSGQQDKRSAEEDGGSGGQVNKRTLYLNS